MNRQELKEREQWLEDQAIVLDKIAKVIGRPFDQAVTQRAGEMRREKEALEKQGRGKDSAA